LQLGTNSLEQWSLLRWLSHGRKHRRRAVSMKGDEIVKGKRFHLGSGKEQTIYEGEMPSASKIAQPRHYQIW